MIRPIKKYKNDVIEINFDNVNVYPVVYTSAKLYKSSNNPVHKNSIVELICFFDRASSNLIDIVIKDRYQGESWGVWKTKTRRVQPTFFI